MELFLWIAGIVASAFLSAFFSWLFTSRYYRKALGSQAAEAKAQLEKLTELVEQGKASADLEQYASRQKRIQDCVAEYRRAGTPVGLIDTYGDLSDGEKAELLDAVSMRHKGHRPKVNKYRSEKAAT